MHAAAGDPGADASERPTEPLPVGQLVRISRYWFGLSSIFTGLALGLAVPLLGLGALLLRPVREPARATGLDRTSRGAA